ncbi:MAG: hypothetical protein LBL86_02205 [Coriobacteriales bacterium]|nr:hypothetical protein [Coriobacteriales bacterium]
MDTIGIFIAVVVILLVMDGFFFLAFRGIVATVGRFAQNNVLRQAGILDELIYKKEETLLNLQHELDERQARVDEFDELAAPTQGPRTAAPDYQTVSQGTYKDADFVREYREIRSNFVFDSGQVARETLERLPTERDPRVAAARRILDEVDLEVTYGLMTLSGEEQQTLLAELFEGEQRALLDEYAERSGYFEIYDFLGWLKQYVFANDVEVSIRTSRPGENFDSLDERVQTSYDDTLCEGISIVSAGKLYDFSIRNREIIG